MHSTEESENILRERIQQKEITYKILKNEN